MIFARTTIGLGTPKSLQEWPPGPVTVTSKRRLPRPSAMIESVPAPSIMMEKSIDIFPARLVEDVPDTAQIAFAFFPHIADEDDRAKPAQTGFAQRARHREQGDDARGIIRDARTVEPLPFATDIERRAGRKTVSMWALMET